MGRTRIVGQVTSSEQTRIRSKQGRRIGIVGLSQGHGGREVVVATQEGIVAEKDQLGRERDTARRQTGRYSHEVSFHR